MRLPDDCTLTPTQYRQVRYEAERALLESGAKGVLPTPMDAIMAAANVTEVKEDVLNPQFIAQLRREAGKVGDVLKRALSKVLGIFHAPSGLVFLDQTLMKVKKRFVGFHESGHGFMPWQRAMYSHIEDSEASLEASAAELFDREANVFASEVMFQGDTFQNLANDCKFGIFTPVNLAKKFGASTYSAIRQYVSKNHRSCAVVVLNMPEYAEEVGFVATLRRSVQSTSFTNAFGENRWASSFTPDDPLGTIVPLKGNRASRPRTITLEDMNHEPTQCIAEAFTNTYQVFILIHAVKTLTETKIILNSRG